MSLDEHVSELIKRIYCAGDNVEEWDRISYDLLRMTGAHAGLTSVADLHHEQINSYRAYGPEDTCFAIGMEEYPYRCVDDPSLQWAIRHQNARFCDSEDAVSDTPYLENDYVKWNLDRFGSTHWYVGYTPPDDGLSFAFSLHFPASQGRGEKQALELFRMVFDHLECAVRVQRRPFNPNSNRSLVLADSEGTVQQVTPGAAKLLSEAGAICIVDGRLATVIPGEQTCLDSALARVVSASVSGHGPAAVQVTHPLGKRAWIVTIRPLLERLGPFGSVRCQLLVEIHDGVPQIGSLELMQSLYDLTGRELQIVRLLADGHSLESLAHVAGISVNTARAHLRAVFAKTATVRQSQLLQLCAGLQQP